MIDSSIYEALRGSFSSRNEAIRLLARDKVFFAKVRAYVLKNNGDQDDVKMVFNDSIIALVKHIIRHKDFKEASIYPYWMGIVKNVWLDQLAKRKKAPQMVEYNTAIIQEEEVSSQAMLIMQGERGDLIRKVLSKLRSNCKEVLLYWAGGYKMKEIAQLLAYKSDTMARKKKHECIQQLFAYLGAHPHLTSALRAY